MTVKLTATGLEITANEPLELLDSSLRGIGQIMFQNNAYTGLLFVLAVLYGSAVLAVALVVGSFVSTLTAMLLSADRALVRAGTYGFNGALVAIALLSFLQPGILTWAFVVVASSCTSLLMAALTRGLATCKAPALTAPFVLTTLAVLLASARFGRLQSTRVVAVAAPKAALLEDVVTASTVAEGCFAGLGQVLFQESTVSGWLVVAGLLVSSRKASALALFGSLVGLGVAWGMGVPEPSIRSGTYGFNSALTAIALGSVVFQWSVRSAAYATFGAVVTAVVFAATSVALEPAHVPALTAPFVLVVWIFVLAGPAFARLHVAQS